MKIRHHRYALLSACVASLLLSACGGGSGGGMIRPATIVPPPPPPPAPPPPPPPPPRSLALPAAPAIKAPLVAPAYDNPADPEFVKRIEGARTRLGDGFSYDPATGNYVFSDPTGWSTLLRTPGSLVQRAGHLEIVDISRIDGGTRVDAGTLKLWSHLHSNVVVAPGATLDIGWADIVGHVENRGVFDATDFGEWYEGDEYYDADIFGNYSQSPEGTLRVHFGMENTQVATPLLTVSGTATLNGTLELIPSGFIPTAGYLEWILHAHGGVIGQFARWTSPGLLLVDANLRYDARNVWLELSRASVQATMASQGADRMTLASAANLDRALAGADRLASLPSSTLSVTQSRFLNSAGHLLWLDDARQATRSLDSLTGSPHADAIEALAREDMLARGIGQRMLGMHAGGEPGPWSHMQGHARVVGADQWITPQLLLGTSATEARGGTVDALGGQTRHQSPQAALYLRWFGNDGWFTGGSLGHAQHALTFDRPIDVASGGRWTAHSQRRLGISSLDLEVGRTLALGHVNLAPYVWLGADITRSERALEQGHTGFELALQANTQANLDAGVGLRLGHRWTFGDSAWVRLDADARYRGRLAQTGDPLRAAFVGLPDLWFDVPGTTHATSGWLDLGLHGGFGRAWTWSFAHGQPLSGSGAGRAWSIGLQRRF